ncbi:methyltransferase [Streptomyces cellulosae]
MSDPMRPRASLRTAVVWEVLQDALERRVKATGRESLDVLDTGGGSGNFAVPAARLGHRVTVVDPSPNALFALERRAAEADVADRVKGVQGDAHGLFDVAERGGYDVVLCHGVLMYVEEPDPLLAGLARMLAPGGLLSLLVRNGDALAIRPGLSGDWAGALAAFDTVSYRNRLGLDVRADRLKDLTATLAGIGAPLHVWYGVRVFTDTAVDGAEVPADIRTLLAVEEKAGRTDPYRGVAALLHLCGVRG